jgi:hypothetical protein
LQYKKCALLSLLLLLLLLLLLSLSLTALMSKNRGLVLRAATVLHLLFHVGLDDGASSEVELDDVYSVPNEVSKEAITAAIDLVELTCQQTAFMVGRGPLEEEVLKYQATVETGRSPLK